MPTALLPEALRKALGKVIADFQREWRKDFEKMQADGQAEVRAAQAESRATQAESRATIAELENQVFQLKEQLRETATLQVTAAIASLPTPRDGRDADPELIKALVTEAIAKLPVPKDGKDADPENIVARLKAALEPFLAETRTASLEAAREAAGTPHNGDTDARAREEIIALAERVHVLEVTSIADAHVRAAVDVAVAGAMATWPVPKDGTPGKDSDPALMEQMAAELSALQTRVGEVAQAAAAKPQVTSELVEEVKAYIAEQAQEAVAAAALDGALVQKVAEAVTHRVLALIPMQSMIDERIPELKALIVESVQTVVAAIPPPKDGKSVDPQEVRALVDEAVAKLPPAKDGKSVEPDEVRAMVAEAVGALPPAAPGKDADPAAIHEMVCDQVDNRFVGLKAEMAEAIAALPPAEPGKPGKDADPGAIQEMVERAAAALPDLVAAEVAKLPPAKEGEPGRPGNDVDPAAVEQMVARAAQALPEMVAAEVAKLPPAEPGAPGKDADPAAVERMVSARVEVEVEKVKESIARAIVNQVAVAVGELPPPEPGTPGKDVDMAAVEQLVVQTVQRETEAMEATLIRTVSKTVADGIAALPPPEPGRPGTPGKDADMSAVQMIIERAIATEVERLAIRPEAITEAIAAEIAKLPPPKAGEPGKSVSVEDVAPLIVGEVQKAVAAIPQPKDGIALADAAIDRDGALVLILSNGATKNLGRVVGRDIDPEDIQRRLREEVAKIPPAKDGEDGLGFDDLFVTQVDERTVLVEFRKGTRSKSFPLAFPVQINRGVFKEGQTYQRGDVVTLGGSQWHCEAETTAEKPGENAKHWKLSVKRGRDAKQLELADVQPLIDKAVARARAGVPLQP